MACSFECVKYYIKGFSTFLTNDVVGGEKMNFYVKFFSETGYELGIALYEEYASKQDVISDVENEITNFKTVKAFPYGEEIGLGSILITSKIAGFSVNKAE